MSNIVEERRHARVPDTPDFERRRTGLIARLRLFILTRQANALLRRTLRPHRIGSAAELSPHLLKDIGLPPDMPL